MGVSVGFEGIVVSHPPEGGKEDNHEPLDLGRHGSVFQIIKARVLGRDP